MTENESLKLKRMKGFKKIKNSSISKMVEKTIEYSLLLKENCDFAPESSFSYGKINEHPIATINVVSCIGIYLRQGDIQLLAHIYDNPKKRMQEIIDYLYQEKVITKEPFQKACIIKSRQTNDANITESKEYLESLIKYVEIIEKDDYPLHFAFGKEGEFYWIFNVKEKQE